MNLTRWNTLTSEYEVLSQTNTIPCNQSTLIMRDSILFGRNMQLPLAHALSLARINSQCALISSPPVKQIRITIFAAYFLNPNHAQLFYSP